MDPATVLKTTKVTVGDQDRPVRPATAAEIAGDADATKAVGAAPDGRVVAFRPTKNLPADTAVTVTFAAGTSSAEGSKVSTKDAPFSGRTYAALALGSTTCGDCRPGAGIALQFNNSLDPQAFDPGTLKISPDLPGAAIAMSGSTIYIQGATQGNTSYTVTVPAGLEDTFGQTLAQPQQGTVTIGSATTSMDPFPNPVTTLDPLAGTPTLSVNTVNRKEFRERIFAVSPTDWAAYQDYYLQVARANEDIPAAPDWPVLVDRVVTVDGAKNTSVATVLDLTAALAKGNGTHNVVVLLEPAKGETFTDHIAWQNRPTMTWAQVTTIGLDAVNDNTTLRAWTTDLRNGSPLAGVTVGLVGGDGSVAAGRSATTGSDGVAGISLTKAGGTALLATKGDQTALLPSMMWNNNWMAGTQRSRLLWYVNDDRQTYRPGETVSVKGWVRVQSPGVQATLTTARSGSKVSYTVRDGDGNSIGHGRVP